MTTSASSIVNVVECPARAGASLHNVVGFFTATIPEAIVDPRLWRCSSVMRGVVFHFMSHDGLLIVL
jgi:hypothetical protein